MGTLHDSNCPLLSPQHQLPAASDPHSTTKFFLPRMHSHRMIPHHELAPIRNRTAKFSSRPGHTTRLNTRPGRTTRLAARSKVTTLLIALCMGTAFGVKTGAASPLRKGLKTGAQSPRASSTYLSTSNGDRELHHDATGAAVPPEVIKQRGELSAVNGNAPGDTYQISYGGKFAILFSKKGENAYRVLREELDKVDQKANNTRREYHIGFDPKMFAKAIIRGLELSDEEYSIDLEDWVFSIQKQSKKLKLDGLLDALKIRHNKFPVLVVQKKL